MTVLCFWPGRLWRPTRMQSIRGKPGNNPQEKASFFPGIFPAFLGQKPSYYRKTQRGRRRLFGFPNVFTSLKGVQRPTAFGRGFGGGEPPTFPLLEVPMSGLQSVYKEMTAFFQPLWPGEDKPLVLGEEIGRAHV